MKLLLDQNLSPRLIDRLEKDYSGIAHVSQFGLAMASDIELWEFAKSRSYLIVTKDYDFIDMAECWGAPPKIICLQVGNCTTDYIENLLKKFKLKVIDFNNNENAHYLILKGAGYA